MLAGVLLHRRRWEVSIFALRRFNHRCASKGAGTLLLNKRCAIRRQITLSRTTTFLDEKNRSGKICVNNHRAVRNDTEFEEKAGYRKGVLIRRCQAGNTEFHISFSISHNNSSPTGYDALIRRIHNARAELSRISINLETRVESTGRFFSRNRLKFLRGRPTMSGARSSFLSFLFSFLSFFFSFSSFLKTIDDF